MNRCVVSCCSLPAGLGSVLTASLALHGVATPIGQLHCPCEFCGISIVATETMMAFPSSLSKMQLCWSQHEIAKRDVSFF